MTRTQWLDIIRPGALSSALFVILGVVLWGDFLHWNESVTSVSESYLFGYVDAWLSQYRFLSRIADCVLAMVIAFVILRLNERYSFIRVRTILPSVFCIAFSGVFLRPHLLSSGSVVALLLFASVASALELTVDVSQRHTFNIGLLLGLSALIYPFSVSYLFVFFYFYYNFNILNLRTFLSTLIGAFLPLFYGSLALWMMGKTNIFSSYFTPNQQIHLWLPKVDSTEMLFVGVLLVVLVGSLVYIWMTYQNESLKPRRMFSFFVQLLLFTILLMLFSRSGFNNLLYTLIFLGSIIVGRVFSITVPNSKISLWSFRVLMVATIAYCFYILVIV